MKKLVLVALLLLLAVPATALADDNYYPSPLPVQTTFQPLYWIDYPALGAVGTEAGGKVGVIKMVPLTPPNSRNPQTEVQSWLLPNVPLAGLPEFAFLPGNVHLQPNFAGAPPDVGSPLIRNPWDEGQHAAVIRYGGCPPQTPPLGRPNNEAQGAGLIRLNNIVVWPTRYFFTTTIAAPGGFVTQYPPTDPNTTPGGGQFSFSTRLNYGYSRTVINQDFFLLSVQPLYVTVHRGTNLGSFNESLLLSCGELTVSSPRPS